MKTGIYRHYNGGFYQVLGVADGGDGNEFAEAQLILGIARHSETEEHLLVAVRMVNHTPKLCVFTATGRLLAGRFVIYVSLTGIHMPGPRMCVRPEAMFNESVQAGPRFQYIGDELPAAHFTNDERSER